VLPTDTDLAGNENAAQQAGAQNGYDYLPVEQAADPSDHYEEGG